MNDGLKNRNVMVSLKLQASHLCAVLAAPFQNGYGKKRKKKKIVLECYLCPYFM